MNIGHKITELRKSNGVSRDALGKMVGTSGAVLGRYERNEITPSVEIAKKIADALEVSLDYLVGNTESMVDRKTLDKILQIQKLNKEDKGHLYALMDAFLLKCNIQQAL